MKDFRMNRSLIALACGTVLALCACGRDGGSHAKGAATSAKPAASAHQTFAATTKSTSNLSSSAIGASTPAPVTNRLLDVAGAVIGHVYVENCLNNNFSLVATTFPAGSRRAAKFGAGPATYSGKDYTLTIDANGGPNASAILTLVPSDDTGYLVYSPRGGMVPTGFMQWYADRLAMGAITYTWKQVPGGGRTLSTFTFSHVVLPPDRNASTAAATGAVTINGKVSCQH